MAGSVCITVMYAVSKKGKADGDRSGILLQYSYGQLGKSFFIRKL